MVLYRSFSPPHIPANVSGAAGRGSLAAMRRFAFDDGAEHVDCGSAIVLSASGAMPGADLAQEEEPFWSAAQTAEFLAGGPISFSFITPSPRSQAGEQAYVCCWVTLGD
jgi:hypothetical protein